MKCIKTSQNGTQLWGFPFEKQQEQLLATDILKLCSTLPSLLSLPTFFVTATAGKTTSGKEKAIVNAFPFHFQLKL